VNLSGKQGLINSLVVKSTLNPELLVSFLLSGYRQFSFISNTGIRIGSFRHFAKGSCPVKWVVFPSSFQNFSGLKWNDWNGNGFKIPLGRG
jgi:hypothetical protein